MKKFLLSIAATFVAVSSLVHGAGSEFYDHSTYPATGAAATSAAMRAELDLIEAGFDKLVGPSGNANKVMKVNSGATAHTTSTITDDGTTTTIASEVSTSGSVTLTGAGKSVVFEGTTADDYETTLSAGEPTADRTITLPNATDTLVGKATTDTLTNKTYDTAGTGNSFSINGTAITAVSGTGSVCLTTSCALTTPTLGVATATSINKVALTAPATGSTLTIADGKTLTASNTLTLTATDGSTLAIGTGGTLGTAAYTASTAYEAAGGIATHAALTATHGVSGAIVGTTDSQILTNKTLTSPAINGTVTTTGLTLPATAFNGAITGGQAATLGATTTTTLGATGLATLNAGTNGSHIKIGNVRFMTIATANDGSLDDALTTFTYDSTAGKFAFRNTNGSATLLTINPSSLVMGAGITSISGGTNPSLNIGSGALTAGAGAFSGALSATTSILSSGATSGIGYTTGAGGTVTQGTNRTTGVTVNKASMAITLVSAAGSTSWQTFTVTNSAVAATDVPHCVQKSGTDLYEIHTTAVGTGSFNLSYRTTGGTTTEQPVFNCVVIKGVTS